MVVGDRTDLLASASSSSAGVASVSALSSRPVASVGSMAAASAGTVPIRRTAADAGIHVRPYRLLRRWRGRRGRAARRAPTDAGPGNGIGTGAQQLDAESRTVGRRRATTEHRGVNQHLLFLSDPTPARLLPPLSFSPSPSR